LEGEHDHVALIPGNDTTKKTWKSCESRKPVGTHKGDPLNVMLSLSPRGDYQLNYRSRSFGGFQERDSELSPSRYVNPQGISLTLGTPDVEGRATATFRSPQTGVVQSTEVICEIFQD
jgi:hypothetical protein